MTSWNKQRTQSPLAANTAKAHASFPTVNENRTTMHETKSIPLNTIVMFAILFSGLTKNPCECKSVVVDFVAKTEQKINLIKLTPTIQLVITKPKNVFLYVSLIVLKCGECINIGSMNKK